MFDYCGDIEASLEDYRALLTQVIQETFPTGKFDVRIRKTKAMSEPKVSIMVVDGPVLDDLAAAIPLLNEVDSGTRWAYHGKVLPLLSWRLRATGKCAHVEYAKAVWSQMKKDNPELGRSCANWVVPSRSRPYSFAKHAELLAEYIRELHPQVPSPTMAEIARGSGSDVVEIAMVQRRDDLDSATPLAADAIGAQRDRIRMRL